MTAAPALAGTLHLAAGGCATGDVAHSDGGMVASGHAGAHGASGHGHPHAPKPATSAVPCCLAGCIAMAAPAAATAARPLVAVHATAVPAILSGHEREPLDPPPRPAFLPRT